MQNIFHTNQPSLVVHHSQKLKHNRTIDLVAKVFAWDLKQRTCYFVHIGHAIKSPTDDDSRELGQSIAAGRADKSPIVQTVIHASQLTEEVIKEMLVDLALRIDTNFLNFICFGKETRKYLTLNPSSARSYRYLNTFIENSNQTQSKQAKVQPRRLRISPANGGSAGVRSEQVRTE